MTYIIDFFTNYLLICAFAGWFSAQFIKCVIYIAKHRKFDFALIMSSGGMPSSHSATVCALVMATAKTCGMGSPEFALAFILAFIVMYDAAGVRRAAGEQAKVLNRMARELSDGNTRYLDKNLKELIGHSPLQVTMGALLGFLIPIIIPAF